VTSPKHAIRLSEPLALAAILLAASATSPAWAYLDPGTGSMMLQLAMGGVAGALVIGRLYLKRASDFLRQVTRRRRSS
jgi:hypothetical protein